MLHELFKWLTGIAVKALIVVIGMLLLYSALQHAIQHVGKAAIDGMEAAKKQNLQNMKPSQVRNLHRYPATGCWSKAKHCENVRRAT